MNAPSPDRFSDSNTPPSFEVTIDNLEALRAFAQSLAKVVRGPLTIALNGTLGAGKTQLVKSFVEAIGGEPSDVTSPTYVLIHCYETEPRVFHLDTYRIGDEDELLDLGFEEILESEAIVFIEWANRFPDNLPRDRIDIQIDLLDASRRSLTLDFHGSTRRELANALRNLLKGVGW